MGNQHSSEEAADKCGAPCFGFQVGKLKPPKKALSSPMGSPEAATPMFQRRKRQEVANQLASSVRSELEQEDSFVVPGPPTTSMSTGEEAQVHEGPNCERELYAKYQLMEVLGVGSTSTVYRCVNKHTNLDFACKIIDKEQMEDRFAGMMNQFQTEIEALRQLQHPSIIRLYDVYLTHDKIYIVMEMMEGGELFDYVVQKGTLNEEEASKIVKKVTSALVYMHDKNIVHRDLKPENLLLRKKPRPNEDVEVKIIDFGLSKAMEESVARTFLGTRGYLAPEMLQRRDYTRAVDTWALGVIVFVLLCGCLPFDDDSQTVPSDDLVRQKFVLRFPRWASNLSASAKDLLSHLLDTNPRTRYTAEQALRHTWVQGQTAPRDNLLASPVQIKKSPILRNNLRGNEQQRRRTPNTNRRRPQQNPCASPDSQASLSPGQEGNKIVRKQSI